MHHATVWSSGSSSLACFASSRYRLKGRIHIIEVQLQGSLHSSGMLCCMSYLPFSTEVLASALPGSLLLGWGPPAAVVLVLRCSRRWRAL